MKISEPQICEEQLIEVNFHESIKQQRQNDLPLVGIIIDHQDCGRIDVSHAVVDKAKFYACDFTGAMLERAAFADVLFESCDFSNSNITEVYFKRCRFSSCKGLGLTGEKPVFKHVVFEQSAFPFVSLDHAVMEYVLFDEVDFRDSSLTYSRLEHFEASNSKFIENDFFKTSLAGIDFSTCELEKPLVSSPPDELRGITVNMFQAASLVSIIGVKVQT